MVTKEAIFQRYEEELDRIDKQAHDAREVARTTLLEQLKSLRTKHHEELKGIRILTQKTKRSK